jgi:hypothetical protein
MQGDKMVLDEGRCVGCGRCIAMCPFDAISAMFDESMDIVDAKIVEYTKALIADKPNFHISLLTDISPQCDCHDNNDMPLVPNVGILASKDPVAIDLAAVELVQQQPILPGSVVFNACGGKKPEDIFAVANDGTRWQSHFSHAEKMGMGDGSYRLIKV